MAAIEPALAALLQGATFIDIGPNIGFYSILALDRVGPSGRVFCFEIDSRPAQAQRKAVKVFRLSNIEVVQANEDGMLTYLPTAPDLPCARFGSTPGSARAL